jgi:membrane protein DedA with SNARE-associated domain
MLRWIVHWVEALGYVGVGLLMAIENVVLPMPSEVIMPLAGFASQRGHMSLWGAILAGTVGSVLGALPLYYAARLIGEKRLTAWIEKHGKWLLLRRRELHKAHDRFERRGAWAVFLSQLLPGVRALISLPAGFARMNVALFALTNFAGTLVWCTALAAAGYALGANYRKVHQYVGPVSWTLLGAAVVGTGVWLVRRRKRRR